MGGPKGSGSGACVKQDISHGALPGAQTRKRPSTGSAEAANPTGVKKARLGVPPETEVPSMPNPSGVAPVQMMCRRHKRPCLIREVRKKGPNEKRMFWTCPLSKNCDFFQVGILSLRSVLIMDKGASE